MKNVAFALHVFDEPISEVEVNIHALKEFYKNSVVLVIYDGVPRQNHIGVIEVEVDRLKLPGKFGAFTHRYLSMFLNDTDCDYVIKIDPDTRIHRTVSDLPNPKNSTIFCRMATDEVPHGGAIGYTRPMADLLVRNEWFLDGKMLIRHRLHPFQDHMMRDIISQKGLHVQVRRDFGWVGKETDTTVFSHTGFFGPYVDDKNVPK